ncbi:MAG: nucleotidyltransferase domain-containing protein [Defluviitaleaceae bacterium]|nr:nucleotidyltransferase domain-containing protein [Defluviitaleaceae bacterium]
MNQKMTQHEKHMQALNSFAMRVEKDPNVIAMLLYGSLAYGTVGRKSDIGITLIVRDGSIANERGFSADEDGIYVSCHGLREVSKFKKDLQELRGGYEHALLGSGKLIFSKDEALIALHEATRKIGVDDAPRAFAAKIDGLFNWMWKAEKHITLINDPLYAQRFLQLSAAIVAEMELIRHRENPNREAIRRARELNPKLMHELYTIPSTTAMTVEDVRHTLDVLDEYLMKHIEWWSRHILRTLCDGEPKLRGWWGAVTYLEEKGVIMRTTLPRRVFKNSKLTVDEVAYVYIKAHEREENHG